MIIPSWINKITLSIAGVILAIGLFFIWLNFVKEEAVEDYKTEIETKAAPAREDSANQAVEDAKINTKNEEDLHNAINQSSKGTTLSAPAKSLACERLRKLGRIPEACRS